MAIWAHQTGKREPTAWLCVDTKASFGLGRSYALNIVGWLLCAFNIALRWLARTSFDADSIYSDLDSPDANSAFLHTGDIRPSPSKDVMSPYNNL
jgi:hypothetical protein